MTSIILSAALLLTPQERALRDDLPRVIDHCAAQTRLMLREIKGAWNPYPERIDRDGCRENVSVYGWTSGFFPGVLWKLYEATGDEDFKTAAIDYTDRLSPLRYYSDNHDVGFMLMCSMGNGKDLAPERKTQYEEIIRDGARQLAKRYNPALGLIRSWNHYDFPVIIDNMMNLELLEWAAKNPYPDETDAMRKERLGLDAIARSHANLTDLNHFRPDSSAYHLVNYDPKHPGRILSIHSKQGASVATAWGRGQAWALYGFTMMYRETKDPRYLKRAIGCADFTINHPNMPEDGIPYWDYGAPGEERDASAGAITASALLELSELLCGGHGVPALSDEETRAARYRAFAVKELASLASPAYLAKVGANKNFLLMHSVGGKPTGSGVDVPFNFTDYYFLEALLRFKKLVDGTTDPRFRTARAEEVRPRDGVGHALAKLRAGEDVTVAYLGGSITSMPGWRNLTTEWLQKTYPSAKVKEVHAAIGGTGSGLGVYRVGRDALDAKPDLLFVEFATNDRKDEIHQIWRAMEGIVRQTWRRNPKTDIVFAYTITSVMTNEYLRGECTRTASAMEALADHYGIPSVCFGPRVAAELRAGRLVMSRGEIETAVPPDTADRDKAIVALLAKEGKILFANDGVHPCPPGHALYLKSIQAAFAAMDALGPVDHGARLVKPFVTDHLEKATLIPITPAMLVGDWHRVDAPGAENRRKLDVERFAGRMGALWEGDRPGNKLKFRFRGTACSLYDLLGPDSAQLRVTVDGRLLAAPIPRFDKYCTYYRLASCKLFEGEEGVHDVEIAIDSVQPSRQAIAFRFKDPEAELKKPKYDGTGFWPGALLIVGDLVTENR